MIEVINPYGFIYITTNIINGKRYIGQRKFTQGWKTYLGSGSAFKEAIKKYGKQNFIRDIVDIAYSKEELDKKEIEWIRNYNADESRNFYNVTKGGRGAKNPNPSYKIVVCLNNSICFLGLKSASEYIGKHYTGISSNIAGKTLSCGVLNNGEKAVWATYEDYKKMSTEEIKSKVFKAQNSNKLDDNYRARKIICITTGEIFNSITEAGVKYNCSRSHISSCCNKKRKHCGKLEDGTKLEWMYCNEYISNLSEEVVQ